MGMVIFQTILFTKKVVADGECAYLYLHKITTLLKGNHLSKIHIVPLSVRCFGCIHKNYEKNIYKIHNFSILIIITSLILESNTQGKFLNHLTSLSLSLSKPTLHSPISHLNCIPYYKYH